MILFPHAKINLGLNVLSKRQDGFHDIESLLYPIPLCDVLEAVVDPTLGRNELIYTRSGLSIPGGVEGDLCYKAVHSIQAIRELPGLRLHLHKVVPMGAGLGGGSSDGAHALRLVNAVCALGLEHEELAPMALELGSDCPFFLQQGPCVARGRGERLSPIALDLGGLWLLLANPGVHVSTAEVYRHTSPTGRTWNWESTAVRQHISEWSKALPNTMETYVIEAYPVVGQLKAMISDHGALHAAMSGSGSTVYGLFRDEPPVLDFPPGTVHWKVRL